MKPRGQTGHTTNHLVSPGDLLIELVSTDKILAKIVMSGLAVFAAVAMIKTWGIDAAGGALIGIYVVGFGVGLIVIRRVISNRSLMKVFSWFLTTLVMAFMSVLFLAVVFPQRAYSWGISTASCLVRPWGSCAAVSRDVAEAALPGYNNPNIPQATPSTRVVAFAWQTSPMEVKPGLRFWSDRGDYWEEQYPDGQTDKFIGPGRLELGGCVGTTVSRIEEPNFQVFIPDKGCPAMVARWRRGDAQWNVLGQMMDVQ
jgi:hypothetical protein